MLLPHHPNGLIPITPINSHSSHHSHPPGNKKPFNPARSAMFLLISLPGWLFIKNASAVFLLQKEDFFLRDGIHIQRSCLKRILMNIRACSECSKKIFSKGSAHGFIPFFVYNIYLNSCKFALIRRLKMLVKNNPGLVFLFFSQSSAWPSKV